MESDKDSKGRFVQKYKFDSNGNKVCGKCSNLKPREKFSFIKAKGIYEATCRDCRNLARKEYRKTQHYKTKEKEYRIKNKDKYFDLRKSWREKNPDKNKKTNNKWQNFKRVNDPNFKIRSNFSRRVNNALSAYVKNGKFLQKKRTEQLLGCTVNKYKEYLESKFYPNSTSGKPMTWDNYGLHGWHIDHIKPCASFDLTNEKEQLECFNYKNTQPMWAEENLSKSASWNDDS